MKNNQDDPSKRVTFNSNDLVEVVESDSRSRSLELWYSQDEIETMIWDEYMNVYTRNSPVEVQTRVRPPVQETPVVEHALASWFNEF